MKQNINTSITSILAVFIFINLKWFSLIPEWARFNLDAKYVLAIVLDKVINSIMSVFCVGGWSNGIKSVIFKQFFNHEFLGLLFH